MIRRPLAAAVVAGLVLLPAGALGAAQEDAADGAPSAEEAVRAAARWLTRQQQPDGGFDGFVPGGGTPDAILALAESAQTESTWGNRPALERVDAVVTDGGDTPLDAARRLARRVEDPAVAARLVTRVALPLGLDPGDEGPLGDLTGAAAEWLADEDVAFADRVELALALLAAGQELPEGTLDGVLSAQQASGGWAADGDAGSEAVDLATTGAAVDLLVLAGADVETGAVPAALAFVGATQSRSGAWPDADGEASVLATAGAIRAIRAVGHDPAGSCWQQELGIDAKATAALPALVDLQGDAGDFGGDDPVRVTGEAVHALSGNWLPVGRAAEACVPDDGGFPVEPSLIVLGAIALVGVGGGVRILRSAPSAF